MTIIPSFLKQPPTITTPMFCLFIFPLPFSLLLSLVSLLVLESKKQFQITANSMALLHSMAPDEEIEKGRSTKDHHGLRSGRSLKPNLFFKKRLLDMFPADKSSLAWRTGRTTSQTPQCLNF